MTKLVVFALTVGGLLAACQREPAHNLVVICIDTVRYDGFMQTTIPDALDPWLDRAQIYDNAVATGPWTMPSVASALTGRYPIEHGAGRFQSDVADLTTDPPTPLDADSLTLPEVLLSNGMRTGAFVSHPFFITGLGLDQGFEVMLAAKGWNRDVENFRAWRKRMPEQRRYFAYLHFMEAHDRHKRSNGKLTEHLDGLEPAVRRDVRERASPQACRAEQGRRCLQHQVYNSALLDLRAGIASILEDLEQGGDLDNTVVIVYSDHGEEFWEHRSEQTRLAEDPRESYGFGHGQSLYQELLHVPLLAWVPGSKGARHETLVSLVDVLPSALEWLGFESASVDTGGRVLPVSSKLSWLRISDVLASDRVVYASGISFGPEKVAARKKHWKSVFTPASDRYEHFDLAADPDERQPLVERDDLQMMFDTLVGDYLEKKRTSTLAASRFDAKQIDALKAIGYLQGYEAETETAQSDSDTDAATSEERP